MFLEILQMIFILEQPNCLQHFSKISGAIKFYNELMLEILKKLYTA